VGTRVIWNGSERVRVMQDTELYRYVLGLEEPWDGERVELDVLHQRIDVWAIHRGGGRWPCPECHEMPSIYDHTLERVWRYLDRCQFNTFLQVRVPRVKCPVHGVKQVGGAWAEERSRFPALFERLAIEVMKA